MKARIYYKGTAQEYRHLISQETVDIIQTAADMSSSMNVFVTSAIRTPHKQAEAMFDNLEAGKRIRYKKPGQEVTAVYDTCKNKKMTANDIKSNMATRIEQLARNGERVSLHCVPDYIYKKRNIVDISPNLNHKEDFVNYLAQDKRVKRIIIPFPCPPLASDALITFDKHEPAIHIEVEPINEY